MYHVLQHKNCIMGKKYIRVPYGFRNKQRLIFSPHT
jgi:hypothetical protein